MYTANHTYFTNSMQFKRNRNKILLSVPEFQARFPSGDANQSKVQKEEKRREKHEKPGTEK